MACCLGLYLASSSADAFLISADSSTARCRLMMAIFVCADPADAVANKAHEAASNRIPEIRTMGNGLLKTRIESRVAQSGQLSAVQRFADFADAALLSRRRAVAVDLAFRNNCDWARSKTSKSYSGPVTWGCQMTPSVSVSEGRFRPHPVPTLRLKRGQGFRKPVPAYAWGYRPK